MTIKAFRKPTQDNAELQTIITAVDDYTRPLTNNPLLDQVVITRIKVSTAKVDIPHSLGRKWVGWVVTRNNAPITVYEDPKQAVPDKYITLVATGSGTIDIYLF